MRRLSTSVLIVGAGPAGLATAIGLAQQNVDFIIIDALPEAQNTSRAAVVHAATLQSMDQLCVADSMIAQGIKVPHFRIRETDQVLLHVDFGVLQSPYPYALMIPQDETEHILVERLRVFGHAVARPRRFRGFERHDKWLHSFVDGEGGQEIIEAEFVVGADGLSSAVRDCSAISFPGKTYGSFLLADIRMDWPLRRDEVALFFSQGGMLVVAPMSQDRYRVVAQDPDAPPVPDVADVQAVLDARGPSSGAAVTEVLWGSRFKVHHRLADRFHKDGVLLVGDAAHVHSPAGGQGMNLGLRDAVALSQALSDAISSGSNSPLVDYDIVRRATAEKVLERTERLTRLATVSPSISRWGRNRLIELAGSFQPVRQDIANALAGYS
ncbi:MAG TPA: FAD-dependent monooxygenase [Pseudorhizobium sp.]|jgi:2-polyprenyl-6-methoxyphenol hydroxylase-like FAD-dependent oxidoreductase|nr:FAD-dependent monooxygenase [Pseudorhizobium sp.]